MIKINKFRKHAFRLLAPSLVYMALASQPAHAIFIQSTDAGTAGFTTTTTVAFDEFGISAGTALTDQYSSLGVTFAPNLVQDAQSCSGFSNFSGACIGNFSPVVDPFEIIFGSTQTQAGFNMAFNPGTSTFQAFLGATLVDSGSVTFGDAFDPNNFFGFSGSSFDRILIDVGGSNNSMIMDNLTLSQASVPEPSILALLGLGIAGIGFTRRKEKKA